MGCGAGATVMCGELDTPYGALVCQRSPMGCGAGATVMCGELDTPYGGRALVCQLADGVGWGQR